MKTFIILLAFMAVSANLAFADTFRCNNVVFSEGDSRADVLLKCGEPDYEEVIKKTSSGEVDKSGAFLSDIEYVVEWYYNCGERHFMKIITFKGGKIISVRNGERGFGENLRNCR